MQKADLQLDGEKRLYHAMVDETVILLNGQRFCLYVAADPTIYKFLHVWLFPTQTIVMTKQFLADLQGETRCRRYSQKLRFLVYERDASRLINALFLVDGGPWLQAALFEEQLQFYYVTHGDRDAVGRVLKGRKPRTEQLANHFRHASADSAET